MLSRPNKRFFTKCFFVHVYNKRSSRQTAARWNQNHGNRKLSHTNGFHLSQKLWQITLMYFCFQKRSKQKRDSVSVQPIVGNFYFHFCFRNFQFVDYFYFIFSRQKCFFRIFLLFEFSLSIKNADLFLGNWTKVKWLLGKSRRDTANGRW